MDKRLFVFMKHGEKAWTLVHFLQKKAMNRVQMKKYNVEYLNVVNISHSPSKICGLGG